MTNKNITPIKTVSKDLAAKIEGLGIQLTDSLSMEEMALAIIDLDESKAQAFFELCEAENVMDGDDAMKAVIDFVLDGLDGKVTLTDVIEKGKKAMRLKEYPGQFAEMPESDLDFSALVNEKIEEDSKGSKSYRMVAAAAVVMLASPASIMRAVF